MSSKASALIVFGLSLIPSGVIFAFPIIWPFWKVCIHCNFLVLQTVPSIFNGMGNSLALTTRIQTDLYVVLLDLKQTFLTWATWYVAVFPIGRCVAPRHQVVVRVSAVVFWKRSEVRDVAVDVVASAIKGHLLPSVLQRYAESPNLLDAMEQDWLTSLLCSTWKQNWSEVGLVVPTTGSVDSFLCLCVCVCVCSILARQPFEALLGPVHPRLAGLTSHCDVDHSLVTFTSWSFAVGSVWKMFWLRERERRWPILNLTWNIWEKHAASEWIFHRFTRFWTTQIFEKKKPQNLNGSIILLKKFDSLASGSYFSCLGLSLTEILETAVPSGWRST